MEAQAAPAREHLTSIVHKDKINRDREGLGRSGDVGASIQPSNPGEENIRGRNEEGGQRGIDRQDEKEDWMRKRKGQEENEDSEEHRKKKKWASGDLVPEQSKQEYVGDSRLG